MKLEKSQHSGPIMVLEGIRKEYPMGAGRGVVALDSVDLQFEAGESVALMGTSGSGKSTMMNILGCLDIPTSGKFYLDGVEVNRLGRDELANLRNQRLGFVFQNFYLLPRTSALENVEMPMLYHPGRGSSRAMRKRAMEALEGVGLADRADHHPSALSGGQQQRVAIARALVNQPRILLADEPTGNLDTATTLDVMALFQKLMDEGLTVILVTHEPELCIFLNRRIELRDGRVVRDELRDKVEKATVARQTYIQKNRILESDQEIAGC